MDLAIASGKKHDALSGTAVVELGRTAVATEGEHPQSRSEPPNLSEFLFITVLPGELLTRLMKSKDWYRDNDTPGLLSNALGVDGDYDAPERNCKLQ
jgi:hypothetical protein